jgi:ABC-type multidrug transport system permease subunit
MLVLFVHEFRQYNVAIALYIGGISTFSLGILLVVSYTYGFEVSVPVENFHHSPFPNDAIHT